MASTGGERYFFAMLNPEKPDLYTQRNNDNRKEDRFLYFIWLRDLKRKKDFSSSFII